MGKQLHHLKLISAKPARRRCTLLDLVQRIQDTGRDDEEVVAIISELIESGEVVLCGTFAGTPFKSPHGWRHWLRNGRPSRNRDARRIARTSRALKGPST